jgi:hypothetical protein
VRQLITRIASGDTVGITLPFQPRVLASQGINHDSLLHLLVAGFNIGHVQKAEVIDRTEFRPFGATRVDEQLAYHVVGDRESRLVFVSATSDSGRVWLTGMHWQAAPADLRRMNPFSLGGKSWLQYGILLLAVVIPLFSVTTAVVAALSRVRYRWVWAATSLLSVGKLSIVWANNGGLRLSPLNFQLFGAGVLKYPMYAPWVVSIGLPAFALGYWLVARRAVARSDPAKGAA